jgi:hypothetical protein
VENVQKRKRVGEGGGRFVQAMVGEEGWDWGEED